MTTATMSFFTLLDPSVYLRRLPTMGLHGKISTSLISLPVVYHFLFDVDLLLDCLSTHGFL